MHRRVELESALNHFMRAHGYLPGPTQRPIGAGLLAGVIAAAPSLSFAWYAGALAAAADAIELRPAVAASIVVALAAVCGALYGRMFMRAANDRCGGWLFGIGFGFLLWMVGPSTIVYWLSKAPLATGRAGQALFASHLLYGLVLGLSFPFIHMMVRRGSPWAEQDLRQPA